MICEVHSIKSFAENHKFQFLFYFAKTQRKVENVDVSVSIELLRLVAINEADYSIEIQFEISLLFMER